MFKKMTLLFSVLLFGMAVSFTASAQHKTIVQSVVVRRDPRLNDKSVHRFARSSSTTMPYGIH